MENGTYVKGEVAGRALEIYERTLRPEVEAGNMGKYLVIEIESENYDVDSDQIALMKRAKAKYPSSVLYLMRIGYRAAGRIGFVPSSKLR